MNQRMLYNKQKLPEEYINLLNDIGFCFETEKSILDKKKWIEQYEYLKEFLNKFNKFPAQSMKYPKDNALGRWVTYQKRGFRHSKLSQEHIDKLKEINFPFPEIKEKT